MYVVNLRGIPHINLSPILVNCLVFVSHLVKLHQLLLKLVFYTLQLCIVENFLQLVMHVVYLFLDIILLHSNLFLFEDSALLVQLKLLAILCQNKLFLYHFFF